MIYQETDPFRVLAAHSQALSLQNMFNMQPNCREEMPRLAQKYGRGTLRAMGHIVKGALFPGLHPFLLGTDDLRGDAKGIGTVIGSITVETEDRERSWTGYEVDFNLVRSSTLPRHLASRVAAELVSRAEDIARADAADSSQAAAIAFSANGLFAQPSIAYEAPSEIAIIALVPGLNPRNIAFGDVLEYSGELQPVHVVGKDRHGVGSTEPVHVFTKTISLE